VTIDADTQSPSGAAATTARWRVAAEAGDIDGFMATLAPEVVFHSPLTTRADFKGHHEVRTLIEAVFATISDIRYTDDVGNESVRALVYRAAVAGQEVHEATIVRLNEDAEVVEVTFWVRPLPGLTALAATLVPALARRRSRLRALSMRLLARPLFWLTRIGDPVGVWLAR
jgi:hypothetical protein